MQKTVRFIISLFRTVTYVETFLSKKMSFLRVWHYCYSLWYINKIVYGKNWGHSVSSPTIFEAIRHLE